MRARIDRSTIQGTVLAPPSKSYTHRAIIMSAMADQTVIHHPLISADTIASIDACIALGAAIKKEKDSLVICGVKGKPAVPENVIDVQNSGTTLRLIMAISALCSGAVVLTGDESIRSRPNKPLITALNRLGARVFSTKGDGTAPIVVKGPMKGGDVEMDGHISSQFFSALLTACPLCPDTTVITVRGLLKSRPYVEITIDMLKMAGISVELDHNTNGNLKFIVPPNQSYSLEEYTVPGDFSSASYILAAGALMGNEITVEGLYSGSQGDAAIIPILQKMGADLHWNREQGRATVNRSLLTGIQVDVSLTPDLVPTLAVLGAAAEGEMVIYNAEHVRYKETDRLHAMTVELLKMGVDITEEPSRLIIRGGGLRGADVSGWYDHRIVMALTVAGLFAGDTTIETAESVDISFPGFFEAMMGLGASISLD